MTALLAAAPSSFVKTALNRQPFKNAGGFPLIVGEVNAGTSIHVFPPSTEISHCTVGVGVPLAAAAKVTVPPAATDWFVGCVVMTGAPGRGV